MKKELFLRKLEEICGLPIKSLNGEESLQRSGFFDSLALLGLIALFDKEFRLNINTREILQLDTIDNLYEKIKEAVKNKGLLQ